MWEAVRTELDVVEVMARAEHISAPSRTSGSTMDMPAARTISPMPADRISRAEFDRFLIDQPPQVRAIARVLRSAVLRAVPTASEAFKFRVPCYFRADAYFGSIGGNICMIEIKKRVVVLSFILGAKVHDPHRLLFGTSKNKRFLCIPDAAFARSTPVAKLVQSAAKVDLFD